MTSLNELIFQSMHSPAGRFFIVDMSVVFLARYLIYILTAYFIFTAILRGKWRKRLSLLSLATLSVILSRGIIVPVVGFLFYNPRPFVSLGFEPLINHVVTSSFPSGHMAFLVPVGLTLWLVRRKAGTWFLAATLLVGVARVVAGVHWPFDILGGILSGIIGFGVAYVLLKKFLVLGDTRAPSEEGGIGEI